MFRDVRIQLWTAEADDFKIFEFTFLTVGTGFLKKDEYAYFALSLDPCPQ